MPSILPGYEYDIFISYRQKDNKTGWVTEFVENLRNEIEATFKEDISIYFDSNPHDGLHETHDVDGSLKEKVKCIVFIPIVSQTYCDPSSFAWQKEFISFLEFVKEDKAGLDVSLNSGNVAKRVLPLRIHEISEADTTLFEKEINGVMRPVDFIYKETGVNRPLEPADSEDKNLTGIRYRNQVNKVANSIQEIIESIKSGSNKPTEQFADPQGKQIEKLRSTGMAHSRRKRIQWIGIPAILVLLALFYFLSQFFGVEPSEVSEQQIENSIAVIPFDNLSSDPEQQFFADGVMEDILTLLQKMEELRVTSKTSVEQYRNESKNASEIGKELGVSFLVEGSVRKSEDQIMITAQLIRTSDDSHLWADNFTSEYTTKGLFEIQRKIAENIVRQLSLKISPKKIEEITQQQTSNKEAYEHFQKGRQLYGLYNRTSNDLAIDQFKLAIQKDPVYAAPHGQLASAFVQKWLRYDNNGIWYDSAIAMANRGIELDSLCAECYKGLAFATQTNGKISQALTYYEKALAINPNYSNALNNSRTQYFAIGNYEKGLSVVDRLMTVDPNNFIFNLGGAYRSLGNSEAALPYMEKSVELQNDADNLSSLLGVYYTLGDINGVREAAKQMYALTGDENRLIADSIRILWMMEKYDEIINCFERNEEQIRSNTNLFWFPELLVTNSYFKIGEIQKGRDFCISNIEFIEDLADKNQGLVEHNAWKSSLVANYSMLGDKENALLWMEKAITSNDLFHSFENPWYDNIRNEPRFKELIKLQEEKRAEAQALMDSYNFPKIEDQITIDRF